MENSRRLGNVDLETLFDEIISKTEQREAFSEAKEANVGFSVIEDMQKLRSEFVAAETELELYFALVKLSNARRDRHLSVSTEDRGLPGPERRSCEAAPIYVLPEILDVHNPTFFVSAGRRRGYLPATERRHRGRQRQFNGRVHRRIFPVE